MFIKKLFKPTKFTGKTLDKLYKEKRFSQEQINVLTEFIGLIKELNVSSKNAPNCYADDKTGEIYCAQYISINKKTSLRPCTCNIFKFIACKGYKDIVIHMIGK